MSEKPENSEKLDKSEDKKNSFWSLGDKNWLDVLRVILLPLMLTIAWPLYQANLQKEATYSRILENYFTSLHELQNDILKYELTHNVDNERRAEAARIIQSLAIAKTQIALNNLDPLRRGQVIQYLHDSNIIPRSYFDYDSSTNFRCEKLKEEQSLIPNKTIIFSDDQQNGKKKIRQKVKINIDDVLISDKKLPGINFGSTGLNKFDFSGSNLDCSSFKKAAVTSANFQDASLRGANFSGSFLIKVDFSGSDLSGANFLNSSFQGVNFDKTILSDVNNLPYEKIKSACNWEKAFYKVKKNEDGKINVDEEANTLYIDEILKKHSQSEPKIKPDCSVFKPLPPS